MMVVPAPPVVILLCREHRLRMVSEPIGGRRPLIRGRLQVHLRLQMTRIQTFLGVMSRVITSIQLLSWFLAAELDRRCCLVLGLQ